MPLPASLERHRVFDAGGACVVIAPPLLRAAGVASLHGAERVAEAAP